MDTPRARRAVGLLPPLATTGIGSLPHTQQELALQSALQMDVPYLPQLPVGRPSEFMIASALDGLPGLTFDEEGMCTVDLAFWSEHQKAFSTALEEALAQGDARPFEPSAQACRAWRPFLWEVENRKLALAKVQLAGPCTVRWVTKTSEGAAASEVLLLDKQILRLLWARSLSMVRALRRLGVTPLFFFDEPGLYALNGSDARHLLALQELKMLVIALQREGALVGVHCCSNTDWPRLLELGLDVLSLDVRLSLDALLEHRSAFLRFWESGATLSLGLLPTDLSSEYRVPELVESVEASFRALWPQGEQWSENLSRMLLSPACGLGLRSVKDAERILGQLRDAQGHLKRLLPAAGAFPVLSTPP